MAEKYGFKLIVGLITGWMSGRLFVPPALEGKNVMTDPEAILWEVRFVKYFVKRFKHYPVIAAWEPGNECNCMNDVKSREGAWLWMSTIVNAIKSVDNERPVISGMHSLSPTGTWSIQDQGELADILTTHPYPLFVPFCDNDPVNTIRTILHSTAESRYYSDMGNKPCFAEEIGTLGPGVSSDAIAGDFARAALFSLWAHDCGGFLWWCSSDFSQLYHAPYDWSPIEPELGLLRPDGTAKPVLNEMHVFSKFLEALPFKKLPERLTEAVCIISRGQNQWGTAYSSFILAKQAGFDIQYQYEAQPLKDAPLYLLPNIKGVEVMNRTQYKELMKKIHAGATLYISYEDGFLSEFEGTTGVRVITRSKWGKTDTLSITTADDENLRLSLQRPVKLDLEPIRAEVLGTDEFGNPVFTCAAYGKGKVYFFAYPLETSMASTPGAFDTDTADPFWKIYKYIARYVMGSRVVSFSEPQVGITEHPLDDDSRIAVLINYSPRPLTVPIRLLEGWNVRRILYGTKPESQDKETIECKIGKNDALILEIKK